MGLTFLGLPLVVWGGLTVFVILVIQILTGLRTIKVDPRIHTKILWKVLLVLAIIHGFLGLSYYL